MPVYIKQENAGTLRIARDGLYTVLEAQAPGGGEALVRLWVHGGGESAYLGVMQPWSDGLWLRRRLSRMELASFPNPIEFASDRETESGETAKEELHNSVNIIKNSAKEETQKAEITEEKNAGAEQPESLHNNKTDHHTCPWPAETPEDGLVWYRRGDGSLVAFDGISSLVAIPAELRGTKPRAAERVIEGKKYLVFRY